MSGDNARQPRPLTTESGAPVADNQHSQTAGAGGPVLLQDQHLLEKLAHFDRERIPERVVHAKGSAAYGHFEVTRDVTRWTRARFLSRVGLRTEGNLAQVTRKEIIDRSVGHFRKADPEYGARLDQAVEAHKARSQ